MRRSIIVFLVLLVALNVYLLWHHRLVALVEATIAINTAACIWFVINAFAAKERAIPIKPEVQAMVVVLLLLLDSIVFMGAYIRLAIVRQPYVVPNIHAPSFGWLGFDGKPHMFAEFSGKPVALHFWGTWCIPCRVEFPKLVSYAAKHPEVTFIAFDANDEPDKGDKFIARLHEKAPANLLLARDSDGAISGDLFKVPGYPTTILVDPKGQMHREYFRSIDWDGEDINAAIGELKPH